MEGEQSDPDLTTGGGRIGDHYFSMLYDELHRVATRELRRNAAVALSPTTLLHETFLNISLRESAVPADRRRFMSYASRAMRVLIIDYLRRRDAQKRGREFEIVPLCEDLELSVQGDIQIERLHEALDALAVMDPRLAQCVDLKFFCGYSFCDIAQLWNVSERTVLRDWDKAQLLLGRMMAAAPEPRRQA
jgi:RNA polymerase sigma factor (TIGR02999 family)